MRSFRHFDFGQELGVHNDWHLPIFFQLFRVLLSATLLQVMSCCPITFWKLAITFRVSAANRLAAGESFLHYKLKNATNFRSMLDNYEES